MSKEFRRKLFDGFRVCKDLGILFDPISTVDSRLEASAGSIFLKHDVHDVALSSCLDLAEEEAALGVFGSYFFMTKCHPRVAGKYEFDEQIKAMHAIRSMGHEIGLHLDPYALIGDTGLCLADALVKSLEDFSCRGIALTVGNMHGNSKHKPIDKNGYNTVFDLFHELGRQQDFPELKSLDHHTADEIRKNRVCLSDFGFDYWADMPLWSKANGFVVTNFLTDNQVGKTGCLDFESYEVTLGSYQVCGSQLPGSRNRTIGRSISLKGWTPMASRRASRSRLSLFDDTFKQFCTQSFDALPLLFLVHPEFY